MITILECIYDSRKSFYNKAKVENLEGILILHSYDIKVCRISPKNREVMLFNIDKYSQTTIRHIKEFLKQNKFKAETKAQILKDYKSYN